MTQIFFFCTWLPIPSHSFINILTIVKPSNQIHISFMEASGNHIGARTVYLNKKIKLHQKGGQEKQGQSGTI